MAIGAAAPPYPLYELRMSELPSTSELFMKICELLKTKPCYESGSVGERAEGGLLQVISSINTLNVVMQNFHFLAYFLSTNQPQVFPFLGMEVAVPIAARSINPSHYVRSF